MIDRSDTLQKQHAARLQKWVGSLALLCTVLAGVDFLYEKHPHVKFEGWFNFFGFSAALFAAILIVVGVVASNFVQRDEDYYDE